MNRTIKCASAGNAVRRLLCGLTLVLATSLSVQAARAPEGPPAPPPERAVGSVPVVTPPGPAAAPADEPTSGGGLGNISAILGPDSELETAPDGQFEFNIDDKGDFSDFRAIKGVSLSTQDFDLFCEELLYTAANGGHMTANVPAKSMVKIDMRQLNTAPGGNQGNKGDTHATCGHYEYYMGEKRHILTRNPLLLMKDKLGKLTEIGGDTITITQDAGGAMRMAVQGRSFIRPAGKKDPNLAKSRERLDTSKATVQIDTNPPVAPTVPVVPGAIQRPGVAATPPPKSLRIEENNVGLLKKPKPARVLKLEQGG